MKKQFTEEIKANGFVILDNGEYIYNVSLVNKENFPDMSEMLENQLKEENLYNNSFIGYVSTPKTRGTIQMLPIYGRTDKYETKWFKPSFDEAIQADLRSRSIGLLKRYA